MPTKHIDKLIEAYVDGQLLPKEHQQVEAHLKECAECARHLFDAERLDKQLGPTIQAALGQPIPRLMLHQKVRQAIQAKSAHPFDFNWTGPAQLLNAFGTVAIIALLAVGVFVVIQGQIPDTTAVPASSSLQTGNDSKEIIRVTPTSIQFVLPAINLTPHPPGPLLNNMFSLSTPSPLLSNTDDLPIPTPSLSKPDNVTTNDRISAALSPQLAPEEDIALEQITKAELPGGTIAFALFNPAPGPKTYDIHFVNPNGTNRRKFALSGVSEPALHPTQTENPLAFRAWSEPTSPRSILSSDIAGNLPQSITNFWEDTQPDWSPIENRIIFASQRESDRYWRLYTVWGDGSLEVNLRREGRSPTFAPDGYRFAFESCDSAGHPCGLWVGDLEHSEYDSKPILVDPLAKAPDWSPVAEEIAYMANPDGNWDLYLVNSDGSNVRRLTDDPASDGLPAWSPDGEWLAFASDRGGKWGIWLLQVEGGRLYQTISFDEAAWIPPDRLPYNQHGERYWWDEQLSWGPEVGDWGLETGD